MNKLIVLPPIKALLLSLLVTLTACGGGGGSTGGGTPSGITGDSSGIDNGSGSVSGKLSVAGGDSFVTVEDAPADYGSFTLTTSGSWAYDVDSSTPSLVALPADVTATENIAVSTVGGLTETIRVTVVGVNDLPEIGTGIGVDSMTISADATDSVAGILTIDDPDTGESVFIPQTNTAGTYGLFSIAESGAWTYTLSSVSISSVANVSVSGTIDDNDTFAVVSADGTQHNVVVTVTGISDEVPADPAEVVTPSEPADVAEVVIVSASDDGTYNSDQAPGNAIDGNTDSDSRWSSEGSGKELLLDLGSAQTAGALQILWFKGDERQSYFNISVLADMDDATQEWVTVFDSQQSSSGSSDTYEVVNFPQLYSASQIKVIGYGNSEGSLWNSVIEVEVYNKSLSEVILPEAPAIPEAGLPDTAVGGTVILPNATDIDLGDWYLSIPVDEGDGYSSSISVNDLTDGYTHSEFFYGVEEADGDKGIVMMSPARGYRTSENTYYVRVELREMLSRGSNNSAKQPENNWVFSSSDDNSRPSDIGGVDGELNVTMAVNYVTTTYGEDYSQLKESDQDKTPSEFEYQVGRVVIGQIHASSDEPIRLYYRKLPSHTKGSIYYYHEPTVGDEVLVNIIGDKDLDDDDAEPSDGIALNEKFSYNITVSGNDLDVTITRDDGSTVVAPTLNMDNSNFDTEDEWHYFKVGLYHLNNTAADGDYVQATFYEILNAHTGYAESEYP